MFRVAIAPVDDRFMLNEPAPKLPSTVPFHVPTSERSRGPSDDPPGGGVGAVGAELVPLPPHEISVTASIAKATSHLIDLIRAPALILD